MHLRILSETDSHWLRRNSNGADLGGNINQIGSERFPVLCKDVVLCKINHDVCVTKITPGIIRGVSKVHTWRT